jgi:CheY-like chemotaxis protein
MTDIAEKKTVLLIEDEGATRLALADVMKGEGFEVLTANDGEEGLKTAIEKHPDIILADLKMPKMTGLEMLAELRKDAWGKDAEVIILTNASDVESLDAAMSLNTFYYIVKSDTGIADVIEKVRARLAAKKV